MGTWSEPLSAGKLLLAWGIVLLALAAGLVIRGGTPDAEAHVWLERTQPANGDVVQTPPPEILLWFSGEIEVKFSHVQVVNSSGERVDNDDLHDHGDKTNPGITMQINVPDGTYTVIWDVLSVVDNHRTNGNFSYYVGAPDSAPPVDGRGPQISLSSGPPEWLDVLTRWFNFVAMALLLGAATAPFLLLPAGFRALSPDSHGGDEEAEMNAAALARVSSLGAAVLVVLVSVLLLWVQAWSAGGSSVSLSAVGDVLSGTRFGNFWFVRITLAGVALLFSMLLLGASDPPWWRSIWAGPNTGWLAILLAALAIPATTSMTSHAAAEGAATLQTAVDWLHLAAAGVLIGGLVQLLLVSSAMAAYVSDRAAFLGALARRLSLVALPTVCLIVGTGVAQSIDRLEGVDGLVDSDYGYTVLAKVGLLLLLVMLGALNLLVIGPRFLRYARERAHELWVRVSALERRFRLVVAVEVTLGVAILAATGLLTSLAPPQGAASPISGGTVTTTNPSGQALGSAVADDLNITVWADPGVPGINEVNVLINDLNGDWKPVQKVTVRFSNLDQGVGGSEEDAKPIHPPVHFIATTTQMSLAGKWNVEVVVQRAGVLDARTEIPIEIDAAAAAPVTVS